MAALDLAAASPCPALAVCGAEFPSRGACSDLRSPDSLPAAFSSSIKVANGETAFDAGAATPGIAGIFIDVATELAAEAITPTTKQDTRQSRTSAIQSVTRLAAAKILPFEPQPTNSWRRRISGSLVLSAIPV